MPGNNAHPLIGPSASSAKMQTRKKDRQLINIVTFEACNSIKESAEAREDHQLLDILRTINYDLIAAEGKYHKACHATYTSKVNIKRKQHDASIKEENTFDEAFSQLLDTITQEFENGKAYDMNVLLRMFKKELGKMGVSAESYSKQKLKARLMKHYKEHLVFHQPPQQFKPEVVYSSSISLIDIINAASNCDPPDTAPPITANMKESATCSFLDIYAVASQIKCEIMKCKGIDIYPLNIEDLQLHTAKGLLPQSLYWLIRWIITGLQYCESSSYIASNAADERNIVMAAQDLVHCTSHAKVKLPKQKRWSGFNTITHPCIPVETIIGYHPMINAEASNFSTLYTVMKLAQKICDAMGQRTSVLTFDLALYSKAKQLQMKYPTEFKNTLIRIGGFHIVLNYLSLLGKKYAQSGLEDLLIESGVYAAGTTSVLMLVRMY
ncbi:hypothetical protein QZH41_000756 [Actinostola sp. cb2023]|nr:hypothetical protein QZH41_000756 [Actinostola sp. cb2023]